MRIHQWIWNLMIELKRVIIGKNSAPGQDQLCCHAMSKRQIYCKVYLFSYLQFHDVYTFSSLFEFSEKKKKEKRH